MFPEKRKLFYLFLFTGFLAGLAIGVFMKSEQSASDPLFTMLIFSTGLSVGAFITRLQQEFRIKGGSHISGEKTINN